MSKQLVILPGWGGSHKTWAAFCDKAKKQFDTVTVIDLPCFGNELCPTEVWGVAEYADFVRNRLLKKSYTHVTLLGHSFGGQVAAYFVAHHPEVCETLVLSGAAVYRPKNSLRRILFGIVAKLGKIILKLPILRTYEKQAKRILYRSADSPDYEKTSGIQKNIFKKVIREDISHLLKKIKIPTLVVWGSRDTYTPLRFGKKIAKNMPNATLNIIDGGTHGLHISKQEELLSTMISFI
jgi:pimeloyl-ACP methyl ester carboxylesterase